MDYSSSINDPEQSAEASPWGTSPGSSPQPNRTTFGSITGDVPSAPFRYPNSNSGLTDEGGFGGSDTEYRRPDTASTVSHGTEPQSEGAAPTESYAEQPGFAADQGPLSPQPQQQQQQQPQQQQQQQQGPKPPAQAQRAQEHQQPRKPPPPQFKLQAKITGLERTGRKDPILRFDVHVRLLGWKFTGSH